MSGHITISNQKILPADKQDNTPEDFTVQGQNYKISCSPDKQEYLITDQTGLLVDSFTSQGLPKSVYILDGNHDGKDEVYIETRENVLLSFTPQIFTGSKFSERLSAWWKKDGWGGWDYVSTGDTSKLNTDELQAYADIVQGYADIDASINQDVVREITYVLAYQGSAEQRLEAGRELYYNMATEKDGRAALKALAKDSSVDSNTRYEAADILALFGISSKDRVEIYSSIMQDTAVTPQIRFNAAKTISYEAEQQQIADVYLSLIRDNPNDAPFVCEIAGALSALGKKDEAISAMENAALDRKSSVFSAHWIANDLWHGGVRDANMAQIYAKIASDYDENTGLSSTQQNVAIQRLLELDVTKAIAVLVDISKNPKKDAFERSDALYYLIQAGAREEALKAALVMAQDESPDKDDVRTVAGDALRGFYKFEDAKLAYRSVAGDASIPDDKSKAFDHHHNRLFAIDRLHFMGLRNEALQYLQDMVQDPRLDVQQRGNIISSEMIFCSREERIKLAQAVLDNPKTPKELREKATHVIEGLMGIKN